MYIDQHNIISNHNEINKRILFLEERIAHYQNNSNNFASLWLTLLSVLFITVTGFNLYNYNEKKKELENLKNKYEKSLEELNNMKIDVLKSLTDDKEENKLIGKGEKSDGNSSKRVV